MNVRAGDVDQLMMMPPSVREWLPEDHLAFFVLDVVAELDLSAFYAAHRADGRGGSVYDPAMMVSVLLYAYCTGERSSRRIERRLVEDVAVRVVAANQRPDHATLARFRRRHQDAIAGLFAQVLGLCVDAGLVDAGVVAIDGTKIAANASFFANRDQEALSAELAEPVGQDATAAAARRVAERVLAEAEQVDAAEDDEDGSEQQGRMPAEWAGGRDRRSRIRAALEAIESRKARDFETRMAERARKEDELGRTLSGPKPSADDRTAGAAAAGEHHRSGFADHPAGRQGRAAGLQRASGRDARAHRACRRGQRHHQRPAPLRADDRRGDRQSRRSWASRWCGHVRGRCGLLDRRQRHRRGGCRGVDRDTKVVVAQGRQARRRQVGSAGEGEPR